jgi:hypothetical protein
VESLTPSAGTSMPKVAELAVNVGVHDPARVEWVASVPLPQTGDRKYDIDFVIELPATIYAPHDQWERLQSLSRLQSPSDAANSGDRSDVDDIRRDILAAASKLKTQREGFERACADAPALLASRQHGPLEANLSALVDQAMQSVSEMRQSLDAVEGEPQKGDPLTRELNLADEFLSHQLLEFLSSAQDSFDKVRAEGSRMVSLSELEWLERMHGRLADGLSSELAYRKQQGFHNPRPESQKDLSRFVERAARLKKHFQDVLFLQAETVSVDRRVGNVTAIVAAVLAAATYVLLLQFVLPGGRGARAGVGLGTTLVIISIAYALKDRIKYLSRVWLGRSLIKMYGQRSLKLKLPAQIDPESREIVEASESFDNEAGVGEDPLAEHAGKTMRVVRLHYHLRAEAHAVPELAKAGIRSIKHIFRYDLSEIFSRLESAVKRVPVLDPTSKRMRFADAPKEYRVPVRLVVKADERQRGFEAKLVMSKRGLERMEDLPETSAFETDTLK